MKKRLLKTVTVLCLLCGFFVPVRVSADDGTYIVIDGCFHYSLTNGKYTYSGYFDKNNDVEIRAVAIQNNSKIRIYFISDQDFNYRDDDDANSCPTSFNYKAVKDYGYFRAYGPSANYGISVFSGNVPVYRFESPANNETEIQKAIALTWGVESVNPTPPSPDYGDLANVRFNTDIAGSGNAAVNNIDHIKWNPDIDSNGVSFDGSERVEIQAIPGNYTASSRESMLTLGVSAFDYNPLRVHLLGQIPVKIGEYTVSWSDVIKQLNAGSISDFLDLRKKDDIWLKSGWIYQIRLVASDYTSAWQTIYNATSSGVQNSLTVENSTDLNMDLVNVIQSINTMNNSQYEDWTINNITINMDNSDGQQTTNKPWWAYLLEAIVKSFNDILSFLANLIGDLMDAITNLFKPSDFEINNYNDFKVELKQNSGLFGQAFDFVSDLKSTFSGVQYQEPILHWQELSFDGIVFLPAADYNLNEYVEMWGLGDFRQIAYICSDGFIFFSLLLLIIRKLNEVLKK